MHSDPSSQLARRQLWGRAGAPREQGSPWQGRGGTAGTGQHSQAGHSHQHRLSQLLPQPQEEKERAWKAPGTLQHILQVWQNCKCQIWPGKTLNILMLIGKAFRQTETDPPTVTGDGKSLSFSKSNTAGNKDQGWLVCQL